MKHITIYASELASAVGMNKYAPAYETAKKVYERFDPVGYRKAVFRNDVTEVRPMNEILSDLDLTEKVSQYINGSEAKGQSVTQMDLDKDELEKHNISLVDVTSFVFTERGKRLEDVSLDRYEKSLCMPIRERNSKFYKQYISYKNDHFGGDEVAAATPNEIEEKGGGGVTADRTNVFVLGGKVDGITESGELVEVKNRQNRIFKFLPLYEKVQIHAYMFLTGITSCRLVQTYNDQDHENTYTFNEQFWDEIREKCKAFVRSIDKLASDTTSQDRLLVLGEFT